MNNGGYRMRHPSNSDMSLVIGVQEYPRRISNNRLTFDCCEVAD